MRLFASPTSAAVAGLLWLAVFSLLFTTGSVLGLWPPAADGGLGGLDLPVGLVFALGLGIALLRPRPDGPGTPKA
jgi:hypothetical protein